MTPLAILSRDHRGHTGPGRDDHGATHGDLVEADIVERYQLEAARLLRSWGWRVVLLWAAPRQRGTDTKRYAARHRLAREFALDHWREHGSGAPVAYVAGHVNAGGGRYGLIGYRRAHNASALLSSSLDGILWDRAEGLDVVHRVAVRPGEGEAWRRNVYATIADAPGAAICYEPGFIDCPGHAHLWTGRGPYLVGEALAKGLQAWREEVVGG